MVNYVRRSHDEYELKTIVIVNIISKYIVTGFGIEHLFSMLDSSPISSLSDDITEYDEGDNKWVYATNPAPYDDRDCNRLGYICDVLKVGKISFAAYAVLLYYITNYMIENNNDDLLEMSTNEHVVAIRKNLINHYDNNTFMGIAKYWSNDLDDFVNDKVGDMLIDTKLSMDDLFPNGIPPNEVLISRFANALEILYENGLDYTVFWQYKDKIVTAFINTFMGG